MFCCVRKSLKVKIQLLRFFSNVRKIASTRGLQWWRRKGHDIVQRPVEALLHVAFCLNTAHSIISSYVRLYTWGFAQKHLHNLKFFFFDGQLYEKLLIFFIESYRIKKHDLLQVPEPRVSGKWIIKYIYWKIEWNIIYLLLL